MIKMLDQKTPEEFQRLLETLLFDIYGSTLTEQELAAFLGYESREELRKAYKAEEIDIPLFTIQHRQGRFVLVYELAGWLAKHWITQLTGDDGEFKPYNLFPD